MKNDEEVIKERFAVTSEVWRWFKRYAGTNRMPNISGCQHRVSLIKQTISGTQTVAIRQPFKGKGHLQK